MLFLVDTEFFKVKCPLTRRASETFLPASLASFASCGRGDWPDPHLHNIHPSRGAVVFEPHLVSYRDSDDDTIHGPSSGASGASAGDTAFDCGPESALTVS